LENNIKKIRELKGISQTDMANALKINRYYLSRIENGRVDLPITLAARIANFLDSSLDEIFLK
jgi:putative transcriptional regulator